MGADTAAVDMAALGRMRLTQHRLTAMAAGGPEQEQWPLVATLNERGVMGAERGGAHAQSCQWAVPGK